MKAKELAIVYMVAGISSRFEGKIKQLAKITDNETLMEYSLNQALPAGFTKIIFIVGNKTEIPFKEKFGDNYRGIPVYYAKQEFNESERDKPWGTCDALCSAGDLIDCPFVICNGDDLYGKEAFKILVNHLKNEKEEASLGYKLINVLPDTGKVHRAIFQIDKNNYVKNIEEIFNIEKSDLEATNTKPEDLCSMNIFALHPKVIEFLKNNLKIFKKEHKGDRKIEFLLPSELSKLIKENKIKIRIYPCNEKWRGITNPGDEVILQEILKNEK